MVKIIERITYRDDDTLENTDRKIEIPGISWDGTWS